jgi:hypothetical protein
MASPTNLRRLAVLLCLGLLLAACSSGDDSSGDEASDEASEDSTTTTEPATTTTEVGDTGSRAGAIDEFRTSVEDDLGDMPGSDTYGEYVSVSDDSGFLTVEVPAAWSDVDGTAGLFGPDVTASTNVQDFFQTYNVSGVEFQATDLAIDETPDEVLDAVSQGQVNDCTVQPRQDYADPLYTGRSQVFEDCAGTAADFVWVAMEPADRSFHGVVGIQIINEADLEALEHILQTFIVNV